MFEASSVNTPLGETPDKTPYTQSPPSPATSVSDGSDVNEPTIADPSVIVGLACRLPGAKTVSQLWDNVAGKKDLLRKMPEDRFNVDAFYHPQGTNKGTTNARYGYFLEGKALSEFDNEFFRISRKEAESMDPQQRLLLEVVYEALEDAGIPMDSIKGSRTSVHVGSFSNDYNSMTTKDLEMYPKYTVTGVGNAILSNRISYFFDLNGPSMTIDTACSSSLVCFHLGNQSLQHGEAEIAIVAGSALHFDPNIYITMTDFGMLSSDGRCRTFDADGSGYVRGEGVCAMVLKRQSSAEAAGDRIRAIVRGTGSNHDGSKSGLMLPNGAAQARLIRQTYKDAGLDPSGTDYFESHGTGTKAGDPIEAKAIGSVFASERQRPLYVGSIKSNLGHLEGASGLAGITKAVMSIESGKILPNMHFNKPNPDIDFDGLKIQVPTEVMDWPASTRNTRRASINSFGYGGSNAHVILEAYKPRLAVGSILPTTFHPSEQRPYLVPLTAHNDKAGKNLVKDIVHYTRTAKNINVADLAHSYSVRRSVLQQRSFAIGQGLDSLVQDLEQPKPWAKWTSPVSESPKIGFVFTGQGAQWHAMGRELIEKSPLFRQTIGRCDDILAKLPDAPEWTCIGELQKSAEDTRLGESLLSQPLCAALQLAIVELLKAWGIVPSAVIGHSSGEIAAAYTAGILSFENTIICAYYRGLYMSQGSNSETRGAMMAVGMTEAESRSVLASYQGRIALAAVNSPTSLTLSGDEDAILELQATLDQQKVFNRRLRVEQAFHSHHMNPLAPGFEKALSGTPGFQPREAQIKMVSSVTGRDSRARAMDASYWAANMTGRVRFSDALAGILLSEDDEQNVDILVEIGAHPALRGPARDVAKSIGLEIPYIASLNRDAPAFESLLASAGQLFSLGYNVDLAAANTDHYIGEPDGDSIAAAPGNLLSDLPSYSWDHGSYWADTRPIREHRLRKTRHTLLGVTVPGSAKTQPLWRSYLRLAEIPWLAEHVVDDKILFPAAGFVSMALEAVFNTVPEGSSISEFLLRDVMFKNALVLNNEEAGTEVVLDLQPLTTSAKSVSSEWFRFSIMSFSSGDVMVEHCHGQIQARKGVAQVTRPESSFSDLETTTNKVKGTELYYSQLRKVGLNYGENFRLLSGPVESGHGFALAKLVFDPSKVVNYEADQCILHPTVLDSAFHVIFAAIESCSGKGLRESFVPTFIRNASISGHLIGQKAKTDEQSFWAACDTQMPGVRVAHNDLRLVAEDSGGNEQELVRLRGLEITALGNDASTTDQKRELFFNIRWQPLFSRLGSSLGNSAASGLGEILSLFAHEVPDATILHLTSDTDSIRQALGALGGAVGEKRRFRSFTPWSNKGDSVLGEKGKGEFDSAWPGLLEFSEPQTASYDLILVSEATQSDIVRFLKPNGYIITNGVALEQPGLSSVFHLQGLSCYKKTPTKLPTAQGPLTVILSKNASPSTHAIVERISKIRQGSLEVITFAEGQASTTDVVSLVSLDEDLFFSGEAEQEKVALHAIQRLIDGLAENIVWVTKDSTGTVDRPEQALVVGLMRTIRSEHDDIRVATLDVESKSISSEQTARRLLEVLGECPGEDELAERDGLLHVPRIQVDSERNSKLPGSGSRDILLKPFRQGRNLALKIGKIGLLDTLAFDDDEDVADPNLQDDEVEIEVRASALNFRDIAASIGIIDDYRLGDEASGVVVRIGRGVASSDFKPGDRVLAIRPGQGAHRSLVRSHKLLCQKIEDMDFVTAASFEAVLMTAYYSLIDVARLQKDEFCLIHAAAGGVGQMAIQLAQMVGAKVIATVGSAEKRAFLKDKFGIPDEMIFSSRDDSFVEGVMQVTDGRGCDVALNSLAGSLLHATWKCIAPLGRLVEIGKRDIHENTKLDMDPFRRNVTYASVDLITLFHCNRRLLGRLMRESYYLIRDGKVLPPGPFKTFTYGQAQKAFRTLQIGKFFGKIVLVPEDDELVPVMPISFTDVPLFRAGKSYLLVGGLGGIGRPLSQWMYRKGARNIAFFSRSGDQSQDAKETIAWLNQRGVYTRVFKGDVSHRSDVESCISELRQDLGGVFQAAMVLRDKPFAQITAEDWKACVHPKTLGTANLHRATEKLDLDFFVCFSSASSVVGSAGQANYAAANSYMDALMRSRRARGLAGTTMNVGVVADVGVVAEDGDLTTILHRLGYDFISEDELLYQIEEAVAAHRGLDAGKDGVDEHQIITGINMRRKDVYWASKPLFRNLYANHDLLSDSNRSQGGRSLPALLQAAASAEERTEILTQAFIAKVAAVLGTPVESIQASQPLTAYGLDSIVAVEFRKWFATSASVDVALFDILGAKSIKVLTSKVSEQLVSNDHTAVSKQDGDATVSLEGPSKTKKGRSPEFTIVPVGSRDHIPLSSFQTRLWFLHNTLEDQSSLNFVVSCHLHGTPDEALLQAALDEFAARNAILRTKYSEGEDFAEQSVGSFKTTITVEDISGENDINSSLEKSIETKRRTPIDIEEGESMNVCLFKLSVDNYRLAFIVHHIALDNGSTKSFVDQYMGIYDALRKSQNLSLVQAPRLSYADFTLWHNAQLETDIYQKDIAWWQETLKDAPKASNLLPFAVSQRTPNRSPERPSVQGSLDTKLLKRLKRISASAGATPFQFLIAAFQSFIHRYTGDEDLTLLMIDGNRPHPEVSDVMGFFVNMIPLRFKLTPQDAFERVLSEATDVVVNALKHNSAPFDSIISSLNLERNVNSFPLGQIAVNYQMYGKPPAFSGADFTVSDFAVQDIPTPCDIALEATEDSASGLELKIQFDATLYEPHDMERFVENFVLFLSSAIKDHRQPIDEIQMCGAKELAYLQANCWKTEVAPDPWAGKSVVSKILEFTRSQPHATAIETSDRETITYDDLRVRADQVAIELDRAGGMAEGLVGIMFPHGIDMVVAMLGVAFTGRGYVPLDPDFARERLRHMALEAGISLMVVHSDLAEYAGSLLPDCNLIVLPDNRISRGVWQQRETDTEGPFYIIYTSGSTGKPKGVVLTESNTRAMLSSHNTHHQFTPQDRILFHSSAAFDLSVAQLWGALTSGATMLLAKNDIRKDPQALAAFMRQGRATVTYFPPTQFATLLTRAQDELRQCSTYRDAIFAGEFLPPRVVRGIYDLGIEGLVVSNQWGPSEATVQTSCHRASYPAESDTNVPIGYGLDNCSHYIVDALLQPVPASVVGEICQGGPQVGKGYIGRPTETARTYVPDPFASPEFLARGWETMYRTGDKARFLRDGQMECLGRIAGDTQIKLRGYRIDLAEVENELHAVAKRLEAPVLDVVVLPRTLSDETSETPQNETLDERQLVAFLVTSQDIQLDLKQKLVKDIHDRASEHLNAYMLPNGYYLATHVPSLSSGKHDRLKLRTMKLDLVFPVSQAHAERATMSPDDESQKILDSIIQVFRDVLKLKKDLPIHPSQSFFELGGHSVLALRLVAKVKGAVDVRIQPKDFFATPTPMALANLVAEKKGLKPLRLSEVEQQVDWQSEATLQDDPKFYPSQQLQRDSDSIGPKILLTGADSLVGLHMLVELLKGNASSRVAVLGTETSMTRSALMVAIQQHNLGEASLLTDRVEFLSGALSMPGLGLSTDEFESLQRSVQSIYHFGSRVSLLKPYSELKQPNVKATEEIIRLAAAAGPDTTVHYLSTWSVAHLQDWRTSQRSDGASQATTIKTEQPPEYFHPMGSDLAYFKTRWTAEMLLTSAARRGIRTSIYRASALAAGNAGDANEETNFFAGLMRDIITTGSVPDLGGEDALDIDLVTPSYIASTVRHIAETHDARGVFHIRNPSPLSIDGFIDALGKLNKETSKAPAGEWLARVEKEGALYAAVAAEYLNMGHRMFSLDDSRTKTVLGNSTREVTCQPVDALYIERLVGSWGL